MADLDPRPVLAVLQENRVRFVVIGAVAAIVHGYPLPTVDVDITPDRRPDNLETLATALRALEAKLLLPDGSGLEFPIDAGFLSGSDSWTLTTRLGDLDVVFLPAGTGGFDDLRRDAIEIDLGTGTPVFVASLADVIRSKEAAGRPKDIAQLPALRQTLEVIRERERRGKG